MNENSLFLEEIEERIRLHNPEIQIFYDKQNKTLYLGKENTDYSLDQLVTKGFTLERGNENTDIATINSIDTGSDKIIVKPASKDRLKSQGQGANITYTYTTEEGNTLDNIGYDPFQRFYQKAEKLKEKIGQSDPVAYQIIQCIGAKVAGINDIARISNMYELKISIEGEIYPLYIEKDKFESLKQDINKIIQNRLESNNTHEYKDRSQIIDDMSQYVILPPELFYDFSKDKNQNEILEDLKDEAKLAPKKATESIVQYETRLKNYYESTKDISQSTDFLKIVSQLALLNPNLTIKIDKDETKAEANQTIYIDANPTDLKCPEGFEYNEKNGVTNKHKTNNGNYISIAVENQNNVPNPDDLKTLPSKAKLTKPADILARDAYKHEKINYPKGKTKEDENYQSPYFKNLKNIIASKTYNNDYIQPEKIGIISRIAAGGKLFLEGANNFCNTMTFQKFLKGALLIGAGVLIVTNIPNLISVVPLLVQVAKLTHVAWAHTLTGVGTIAEHEIFLSSAISAIVLSIPLIMLIKKYGKKILNSFKNKSNDELVEEETEENEPPQQIQPELAAANENTPENNYQINEDNIGEIENIIKNHTDNIRNAKSEIQRLSEILELQTDDKTKSETNKQIQYWVTILYKNLKELTELVKNYKLNINPEDYTKSPNTEEQGRSLS